MITSSVSTISFSLSLTLKSDPSFEKTQGQKIGQVDMTSSYSLSLLYLSLLPPADWQEAVESSRKHLLRWSKDRKLPYLTEFAKSEGGTRNYMTHLACFARMSSFFFLFSFFLSH